MSSRGINQMNDVLNYAWIIWLALIMVFVIVEMFTLEFTFLMIALGSLGGLLSGLVGVPWWGQIIVAAVLSLLLLTVLKPPLLQALKKGGDPAKSNTDAVLGLDGVVVIPLTLGSGQVRLANGETWSARLPHPANNELALGAHVTVEMIDGATVIVSPMERNPDN